MTVTGFPSGFFRVLPTHIVSTGRPVPFCQQQQDAGRRHGPERRVPERVWTSRDDLRTESPEKDRPEHRDLRIQPGFRGNMLFTLRCCTRSFVVSPDGERNGVPFGKAGSAPGLFGVVGRHRRRTTGGNVPSVVERLCSVVMVFDKEFQFSQ